MTGRGVLLAEVGVLYNLPALHDLGTTTKTNFGGPISLKACGGELADIIALGRESDSFDAFLVGMFALCTRNHMVKDAVDNVID